MIIKYNLKRENGSEIIIDIDLLRVFNPLDYIDKNLPEWTNLEYLQCSNCPLMQEDTAYCPAAIEIYNVSEHFNGIFSYEKVLVRVESPDRNYMKETDVQSAIHSLLGLLFATSGCPILSRMKHMAYNHLPFATVEESIIRTSAYYLLNQYFKSLNGEQGDFELAELEILYADISNVNYQLKKRFVDMNRWDANSNAINAFFSLSELVRMSLKEKLNDIKRYFD